MGKKLMILGGNYFQMTATKAAKNLGLYVVSVDYLPDNPAHKFADEYHNISTVDKKKILSLAKSLKIDGILAYASDVSAPTAAYVAEKMGLPSNPYDSVTTLTNKGLMRSFMRANGFNLPEFGVFSDAESAYEFSKKLNRRCIIKPSDSAGSKGVADIDSDYDNFEQKFENAISFSQEKRVIVEEFIEKKGYQLDGDCFILNGEIVFSAFMNKYSDRLCSPYVPIGEGYPSFLTNEQKQKALNEIERMIKLLGVGFGAINTDFIFDTDGNLYILEIAPRNGGGMISDIISESCGVDLANCAVKMAVGLPCDKSEFIFCEQKFVSSYRLHSQKNGILRAVEYSREIRGDILISSEWRKIGEQINKFDHSALAFGILVLKHGSYEQMCYRMENMGEFVKIHIE